MTKEELIELRDELLTIKEEEKERDLHLKSLATGSVQGPCVGRPSVDKPWLKYYTDEQIKTDMPNMSAYQYLY